MRIPEYIKLLKPYVPGKPIKDLEKDLGVTGAIKLASNENPFGPSPRAMAAVRNALREVHRYPDGRGYDLKMALSRVLRVRPNTIILGNGSNEIIELLIRTFLTRGEEAVMGDPSFLVYDLAVRAAGGKSIRVPLKDFHYDIQRMKEKIGRKTRLVFFASPNNPTGTIVRRKPLEEFMRGLNDRVLCVLDEAYCEFVTDPEYPDSRTYIKKHKNIIGLRTFSKAHGLAGLRIGYGIAHEEIVSYLEKVRQPFNVNSLAQVAARAALHDGDHVRKTVENNRKGLALLYSGIKKLGLEYVPSQANFLLVRVKNGWHVYEALLRKGVIVRPMDEYGLPEYIRVTVGLPRENQRFLTALERVIK